MRDNNVLRMLDLAWDRRFGTSFCRFGFAYNRNLNKYS